MTKPDSNAPHKRGFMTRLLLLLVTLVILYWVGALLWTAVIKPTLIKNNVPEAVRALYGELPPALVKDQKISIRKGNIHGVSIAVPSYYLQFPFAYKDKSVWEAPKPGDKPASQRTYEDAVAGFTVYVRWPDMAPRSVETQKSYWDSRQKPGEHPWLSINVIPDQIDSRGRDLGWAPVLRGLMLRLSKEQLAKSPAGVVDPTDPEKIRRIETTDIRYVLHGTDSITGLQWAEPVGSGAEYFHSWNKALYWQGDPDGLVTDLIECYNGKFVNPDSYQKCVYHFKLPEWGAGISIYHPRSWLPRWHEIKAKTRELLLSFQVHPEAETQTDQTTKRSKESW